MREYTTLTREAVDVVEGAAQYMSETTPMEHWSDKMLDLLLNGPTINGIKKDEVRALLRQTYAALKRYEVIGPMASPFMNDPTAIVALAFRELYPRLEYYAQYVPGLKDEEGKPAYGLTIFPDDGSTPIVCISAEVPISAGPELLAHELAHVAAGEAVEHGPEWKAAEEAIFQKYNEIPPPAKPVTQYGDLWILGKHRVLCGDCTRPEDRALLLGGATPEILLTDPPYCSGGSKESQKSTGSIGTTHKDGKAPKIANDILSTRGYQNLIRGALTDIPCLYAYIFTDWRMWVYLFDLVEAAGFGVKSEIVWDKGTPGMGVGWRSQHELILFGARAATHFDGHKGYGNVLSISRSGNELHPTQKPVELLEKLVDNTDFAKGVYDPFGGSGTTMAACEAHGQPSYLMELTPAYTDVIVKRYISITGKNNVRCVRQGKELPREAIAEIFEPDDEGGEQE